MNNKKDLEFEKDLEEIENVNDIGKEFWALPINPILIEKLKFDICQMILNYQQIKNLNDQQLVHKLKINEKELEDISFCRLPYLNLDNLINYLNNLTKVTEVKLQTEENL